MLAGTTVALGMAAHALGGGGVDLSRLPLIVAALAGVAATLAADRVAGYHRRTGAGVVGLVGGGQLAMHLVLSRSLTAHTSLAEIESGLSCGLVAAHAVATGVLIALVLGVQRVLDLPITLVSRARTWLWTRFAITLVPSDEFSGVPAIPADEHIHAIRMARHGRVRSRRGPPAVATI